MNNILITGSTGFVGKQVLKHLKNKNVKIRVVTRNNQKQFFSSCENVTEIVTTQNFFLETAKWYEKVCKDIDIVIHIAWYAERGKYIESDLNLECLSGTLNFAQAAAKQGVKKFVGVGTCFEYDLTSTVPLKTTSKLNPQHLYSIAKASAFLILSKYFENKSIDFLWARIFYLFGEGEDERSLFGELRKKLAAGDIVKLTEGKQIRDFIDVEVAGSIIANASLGSNVGPFNVCSGIGKSVRELAENIASEYDAVNLLQFGARNENPSDEPHVVGVCSRVLTKK
tara:strand:- start:737 stop:1585 length:849 start_codon:yes stop_codon:yes gene_type:complete